MDISPYVIFQIILSFLVLQLILLQLLIYIKQREKEYIWGIGIAILLIIFCLSEAYVSRASFIPSTENPGGLLPVPPFLSHLVTKIQHTAISIYPLSIIMFWIAILNDDRLKKALKIFSVISILCIASIWFTDLYLSGKYIYKTLNEGTGFFRLSQWDYENIGYCALLSMLSIFASYIVAAVYLFKSPIQYIQKEKKVFVYAILIHAVCLTNDLAQWVIYGYTMFHIVGVGLIAILISFIYIISAKQHNIFLEANRLNLQLDKTVKIRTHELQDLNRHLEERVQERTEDLMKKEAQLAQTSKMESLGLLATGIAHDMNNILLAITGNLQLIKDEDVRNEAVDKVKGSLRSCSKAKEMIRRLYTFSTQKSASLHLENVSDVINLSLIIFKGSSKFVHIDLKEPEESVYAYIESASFMSLLLNLFINARDAMEDRGTLSISYYTAVFPNRNYPRQVPEQEYIHMKVTDTGSGIEKEAAEKIWSPFFTTKKPGKGTGLGLAMAKDIMKKHGGDIWFESREGVGTTFHLLARTAIPGINNEYIPVQRIELPDLLNIMLVEDRHDTVDVISGFLESFGYSPEVYKHSTDALSAFRKEADRFDILLTDYAMPEMNGIELARECKTIRPDFPVILFSGNIQQDPKSPYIEKFIAKPFSPVELKNSILGVIRTRN